MLFRFMRRETNLNPLLVYLEQYWKTIFGKYVYFSHRQYSFIQLSIWFLTSPFQQCFSQLTSVIIYLKLLIIEYFLILCSVMCQKHLKVSLQGYYD